jgi:signal transduction histidine kinase
VILAAFATIVALYTNSQIHKQFNGELGSAATKLAHETPVGTTPAGKGIVCDMTLLKDSANSGEAQIRIYDPRSAATLCSAPANASGAKPNFPVPLQPGITQQLGYRVVVRQLQVKPAGKVLLLYARPLSEVEQTVARVRFFLLLGVLGGAVLALAAGLFVARRAMRPIAELTEAAREIERTRDPSLQIPFPEAEDEIADLARTLDGMLAALEAGRAEAEAMLGRQREFIADASHELRTPLTSVLANLELLSEELEGEQADTAQAALRSTRRMRRLVGDLLLLARADAGRPAPRRAIVGLHEVLVEAAGELEPVANGHELTIDADPALVAGTRDDLHRLALNLLENAIRHTPPGTHVRAATTTSAGEVLLTVEDDGPGIPPELERRVFERFVRGGRDGARGSGLGLAIVRAVVESHGGNVALEHPLEGRGIRFLITIPAAQAPAAVTPAP